MVLLIFVWLFNSPLILNAFVYFMYEVGWGSFHLGFSNNTDPEPGRCRRTDGKKWRCSRDAVADQKYCERHMNRGRHRSRKPVEGQSGHASTGTSTSSGNTSKLINIASSQSAPAVVVPSGGCGVSNSLTTAHQQLNNLQPGASNPPVAATINRWGYLQSLMPSKLLALLASIPWKSSPSSKLVC